MFGELYARQCGEIIELLARSEVSGDEMVPACPGWTVADVARHLVGLADNWITGDLEVYASTEWTARQVASFAEVRVEDLADAWTPRIAEFRRFLDSPNEFDHLPDSIETVVGPVPTKTFPAGVVVDVSQHRADILTTLGIDACLDEVTLTACNRFMMAGLRGVWRAMDLPPLAVSTSDSGEKYSLGEAPAVVELSLGSFDLFRTLGGRRTAAQIAGLAWNGDAADVGRAGERIVVPFFVVPDAEVEESVG